MEEPSWSTSESSSFSVVVAKINVKSKVKKGNLESEGYLQHLVDIDKNSRLPCLFGSAFQQLNQSKTKNLKHSNLVLSLF